MPDLTIKPNSGSGNKVIIQDQAGAAVLTTADSGATLSNGLAMGTPASVTLTNATFPAGIMMWIGEKRVTSAAASISNATSWTKTGNGTSARDLDLTIPAATVAKFSKIYVIQTLSLRGSTALP